ncbi:putative CRISPR-associated protein, VVA1548 family [mine drainage metagenome]|uniref:Putative CRISPR-associated protein, VVA1548 family n=1 Tax=mine drainage metagenome TaxID=410659 RepID=T1BVG7_9ZZZZ
MNRIISFLGTGEYHQTTYCWEGRGQFETCYVAEALARLAPARLVTLLATREARDMHGKALESQLNKDHIETQWCELPHGQSTEEQWKEFESLRTIIETEHENGVVLDITHGFRAQPFFAGAVLFVLLAIGRLPKDLRVVYAEYDRQQGRGNVWDLTLFLELAGWAVALNLFRRAGVADQLVQLSERVRRHEAQQRIGSSYPSFHSLVKAIENIANDMAAIRIASIVTGYAQDDTQKHKVHGSAMHVLKQIEMHQDEVKQKLPALAVILNELRDQLAPLVASQLDGEEGRAALCALARHYLALGRLPEAAVVLRESRVNLYAENPGATEINRLGFDKDARTKAEARFRCDDPLARAIAEVRNDIEHGGMRSQPLSACVLRQRLENIVNQCSSLSGTCTNPSQVRTWFVSRHPGARNWARSQGLAVDKFVEHIEVAQVRPGDKVIGSLPVTLAADICKSGARYLHLSVNLPREARGRELTEEEMRYYGARVEEHQVYKIGC